PRSVDSVGSNAAGFGVRLRLASFRLPSGRTLSHLPANDGVDENHRVWPRVPRALFDEPRVEMDPKREEKHRIRANFGQKRVRGGVNREQKQRGMEGWENNGARVRSPLPVERTVKPWGTHGHNVLALQ
ncbi:hypothetical protein NPIL_123061, partial [Nephila pilipes]